MCIRDRSTPFHKKQGKIESLGATLLNSLAAVLSKEIWPPCAFININLLNPISANWTPTSLINKVIKLEERDMVPSNPLCSGEKPIYWVGSFFKGVSDGINFKTSHMISSTKILSVAKGKWGPCCSTAPNGQIIVDLISFEIFFTSGHDKSVSYTHLTLPTNREV